MQLKEHFPEQLHHASLIEDNPSTLVICPGTNNLTKKNQTANQTAQKIIEIAKSCHQGGVNNIFVSGITCRPKFKVKVNTEYSSWK